MLSLPRRSGLQDTLERCAAAERRALRLISCAVHKGCHRALLPSCFWDILERHHELTHVVCFLSSTKQHIMIDLGTGNNNKINWPMEDKQEMIDIIETVYRGASKGRGWVARLSDED